MDAVIVLEFLILLAVGSQRWGCDSRPRLHSKEHELALYGLTWNELTPETGLHQLSTFVRSQLATILAAGNGD